MTAPVRTRQANLSSRLTVENAACTIDPRRAPITVARIDLDDESVRPVLSGEELPAGEVVALVRLHGSPLGMIRARLGAPGDASELVGLARRELDEQVAAHLAQDAVAPSCALTRRARLADAPAISVVVATRERPQSLARCLDSLLGLRYPHLEVIVVDNAPETGATAQLVAERYRGAVTYVEEPVRGLASAHNRGLAHARGAIVAFTDDDVIVDREWAGALAEAFAASPRAACVTGLILPAQLATTAQAMLERRGGFAKGFSRAEHALCLPGAHPLFPFTAGRLGSGANMAFTAAALREIGGFDPCTGAGTIARGGDDLLAFFRVAAAGHSVVYQPDALVWHQHRQHESALADQAFGYGVGLGAYLTAAIAREPRMVPLLLRRLPRGVLYALRNSRPDAADPEAWPSRLARLERRGLLYGPVAYGRSRWQARSRRSSPAAAAVGTARRGGNHA